MDKDPFEYEVCSKEWYQTIYDIGRNFLLLFIVGTFVLFLENTVIYISDSPYTTVTDSWFSQFTSNFLLPIYRILAPCHMIPTIVHNTILSVQDSSQSNFHILLLVVATTVLMVVHFFAYIASKKNYSWMQFEVFTIIIDIVGILCFAYIDKSIGIKTIIRIAFHVLYIFTLGFTARCGRIAVSMETDKSDKVTEPSDNN